jgi:uncharacterized repeat protein (TIGR03833 family)
VGKASALQANDVIVGSDSSDIPLFPLAGERGVRGDRGNILLDGQNRSNIRPGIEVDIILKADQRTGKRTRGIVKDILTSAAFHSRGIKVRLQDGQIGRVQEIIG